MDMTKFSTLIAMLLSASAGLPDEVQLFNGKDLDGWVAEGVREFVKDGRTLPVWSVKDGHLVGTGKGFGFLRYDRRTFADFVFHVEFRMAPGCNSGLDIRTRSFDPARSLATRPSFYGYEIQLFDDAGKTPTVHSSGSLCRYVAPRKKAILPAGTTGAIPKRGDFDSTIRSLPATTCDKRVEDPRSAFNFAGKIHLLTTVSGESSVSENLAPDALEN